MDNLLDEWIEEVERLRAENKELLAELKRMVTYYEPGETRPEAVAKIRDAKAAIAGCEK